MYIDFKLSRDTQDYPNKSEEGKGEKGEKIKMEHDKEGNMKTSEEGIENSRQQTKGVSEKEKGRNSVEKPGSSLS